MFTISYRYFFLIKTNYFAHSLDYENANLQTLNGSRTKSNKFFKKKKICIYPIKLQLYTSIYLVIITYILYIIYTYICTLKKHNLIKNIYLKRMHMVETNKDSQTLKKSQF